MALTNNETLWLQGFYSYYHGTTRPTSAGAKRDGWDAGKASKNATTVGTGGYGGKP